MKMTMNMAALQPEEIIVDPKEHDMMEEGADEPSKRGPDSPDGVDGLEPAMGAAAREHEDDDEAECDSDEMDDESGSESEEEDEEDEEDEEEAMPDGDTNDDLHALLAFSKSRLEKAPQSTSPPPAAEPTPVGGDDDDDDDDDSDDENSEDGDGAQSEGGEPPASDSPVVVGVGDDDKGHSEEKKIDIAEAATTTGAPAEAEEPAAVVKDQAYYIELALKKKQEADMKAKDDEDPGYLLKLAEKKVAEAQAKARKDEEEFTREETGVLKLAERKVAEAQAKAMKDEVEMASGADGVVVKPAVEAKQTRSENTELWALLNYSKRRLETGSTPQVEKGGKRRPSSSRPGSKAGSLRGGDGDNQSVSSKLSKSSRRSLNSNAPVVAVVGGPGDLKSPQEPTAVAPATTAEGEAVEKVDEPGEAPFPNVTAAADEASVDGSVSSGSGTKNSVANDNDDESEDSDNDDEDDEGESSSDDDDESEEESEDELPDFLRDDDTEAIDAEEQQAMYEAAKFKAASILSVSEAKLTDVQMLQAIAIAEDAARKGDEKFSTRRSLFKLNEARVEDLKSFLKDSFASPRNGGDGAKRAAEQEKEESEPVGWGIGRGRLMKKLGSVAKDFREKCNEIDNKKQQEREGQPTNKEIISAAMLDLKTQIDEYEKLVAAKKNKGKQLGSN